MNSMESTCNVKFIVGMALKMLIQKKVLKWLLAATNDFRNISKKLVNYK